MTRISKYLTLEEATHSETAQRRGIDNTPNAEELAAMKFIATNIFDKVREWVGGPLFASSFFRCWALNTLIGGSSKTSQHPRGEAIDINCKVFGFGTNLAIFTFIKDNLVFDQLILEYPDPDGAPSWVHVSLCQDQQKNRREVLVKLKAKYIPFIHYKPGMT